MTRIIGGSAGGRRIDTPRGLHTRPTSDRVREALFSAIESWCGSLAGLRFLDLYAGSGAVGLEARSRGAGVVTMVEHDRRTAALIGANVKTLGFAQVEVLATTVATTLVRCPVAPYDVVFLDPPYGSAATGELHKALGKLAASGLVDEGGLVVTEHEWRAAPDEAYAPLTLIERRRYGQTAVSIYREGQEAS